MHHDVRSRQDIHYECSCAQNLRDLEAGSLKELERGGVFESQLLAEHQGCQSTERLHQEMKGPYRPHATETPALWLARIKASLDSHSSLIRVDDGKEWEKTIPDAKLHQLRAHDTITTVRQPPRWVCTKCGWAQRGSGVSHRCDPAALIKAKQKLGLAHRASAADRLDGNYRLTVRKLANGDFQMGEELVVDGRVIEEAPIGEPEGWSVMESKLAVELTDRFES